MSWISAIWGDEKETQFKGFTLLVVSSFFFLALLLLLILRHFGLGDRLLVHPLGYFSLLAFSVALLSFKKLFTASTLLAMLLFLELFLGYGPLALAKLGIDSRLRSFLPSQTVRSEKFEFHPLLAAIPHANYKSGSFTHSSASLRNGRQPFDPNKPHIAVFGGSSTYDIGVTDDSKTWVSLLNDFLPSFSVSNNGVPGYSTAEHVVQTAFYENRAGTEPVCAVYYVGWNDIRNFGFDSLDNGYADFHLPSQYGNLSLRYQPNSASPLFNLVGTYVWRTELPFPKYSGNPGKDVLSDDAVFDVVSRNLEVIGAINDSRGIRTVLIAQLLNRGRLINETRGYGWLPNVTDANVWPLQHRFNVYLAQEAKALSMGFIYPDIELFDETDFVDIGHFSNSGAEKFSRLIANDIAAMCTGE